MSLVTWRVLTLVGRIRDPVSRLANKSKQEEDGILPSLSLPFIIPGAGCIWRLRHLRHLPLLRKEGDMDLARSRGGIGGGIGDDVTESWGLEIKVREGDSFSTLMSLNRLRAKLWRERESTSRRMLNKGFDRPKELPRSIQFGLSGRRGGLGDVWGRGVWMSVGLPESERCSKTLVGEYHSHSSEPSIGLTGSWTVRGERPRWGSTDVLLAVRIGYWARGLSRWRDEWPWIVNINSFWYN